MKPSTRKPMVRVWIDQTISEVSAAIDNMEAGTPGADYRRLFGAINMADVFITHNKGVWRGCDLKPVQLHDPDDIVHKTMVSLGTMMHAGQLPWKHDGDMLRELLDALVEICEVLPACEVERCRNIAHARTIAYVMEA